MTRSTASKVGTGAQNGSSWAAVVSLGLGAFAITMAEFLPASLLPHIASDVDSTVGEAGQAVSVTAILAVLSATLISALLPRADRRRVMLGLTVLAAVSNVVVALAPNLIVLLSARAILGVALGGFWAMATAMAVRLVRLEQVGKALTVINAGVSAATVAAVPLGAWLGEVWGWRGVFVLAAGVTAVALVIQFVTLPRGASAPSGGLRALGTVLKSRIVIAGLLASLLIFSGHFSGFTYIRPAATDLSDVPASTFALVLLVFGGSLFLGTALSGPLADRLPRLGRIFFPGVLGLGMLVMLLLGTSTTGLFVAAVIWGFGFGGVPTTLLSWGAHAEPSRLEQIGGVIVAVCNLGIAAGAAVGGVIVDTATPSTPLLVGGIASIVGAVLLSALPQRR